MAVADFELVLSAVGRSPSHNGSTRGDGEGADISRSHTGGGDLKIYFVEIQVEIAGRVLTEGDIHAGVGITGQRHLVIVPVVVGANHDGVDRGETDHTLSRTHTHNDAT